MSKGMINFNSRDWNSIRDTIDKINEIGEMQFGKTEDGENIIFDVVNYGDGDCLKTEVFQSNGWIRTNIYHPEDYSIEELYKKETPTARTCPTCGCAC